jgi:CheY-like chemotaxis protein
MDLQMPEMDGFEATEKILKLISDDPRQQTYPCNIVALTSYTDNKTIERCYSIGMKDVIHKPLDYNTLKRIVMTYHYGLSDMEYKQYLKEEIV